MNKIFPMCSVEKYSLYRLFGLSPAASPHDILDKCKKSCEKWSLASVRDKISSNMTPAEASVIAQKVYVEGEKYLKTSAAILLDPSARQCYDAWLSALSSNSSANRRLCRARLLWFNDTSTTIQFSKEMIDSISIEESEPPKKKPKRTVASLPKCRECMTSFDLNEQYLVLHCHCTTRVGHVSCLEQFSARVKHKCPVCRQKLLQRHQVSKYLFWNVKEKYKFIS